MDKYNVEKGEEGENFVYEIVHTVLEEMDYKYKINRNAILPFESVYGVAGFITAEFDITVFTPFYIFLIEIKNECYLEFDYQEPLWKLKNGETASNPLSQNHTHKNVFCSELRIPREKVITIEVLLQNGKNANENSPYPNDYVFDKNELQQKLRYLFATESDQKNDVDISSKLFLEKINRYKLKKEDHIANLKRTEKIETRIRRVIGWINLRRTDIVLCEKCNTGKLCFREKKYKSTYKNDRASTHYFLGCSNYGDNEIKCSGLIYVDANKCSDEFRNIEPITIEQKNDWEEEKVVRTILDEMESLKNKYDDVREQNNILKAKNNEIQSCYNKYFEKAEQKIIEMTEKEKKAREEAEILKKEFGRFTKIFGKFYLKR